MSLTGLEEACKAGARNYIGIGEEKERRDMDWSKGTERYAPATKGTWKTYLSKPAGWMKHAVWCLYVCMCQYVYISMCVHMQVCPCVHLCDSLCLYYAHVCLSVFSLQQCKAPDWP